MPSAAISSGPMVPSGTEGIVGVGNPCGRAPTVSTPFSARLNTPVTRVAPTTATNTAGILFVTRGRISKIANVAAPMASAVPFVLSSPCTKALHSSMKPSASVE
jgi:hypothetical protein